MYVFMCVCVYIYIYIYIYIYSVVTFHNQILLLITIFVQSLLFCRYLFFLIYSYIFNFFEAKILIRAKIISIILGSVDFVNLKIY